jgi:preprotein translocase subunit SecE
VTQTRGDAVTTSHPRPTARSGRGPVARIGRFLREVVAELGKVIWPTRKELVTYTAVVIVFVSIMVALVAGLDIMFAKVVILVFG